MLCTGRDLDLLERLQIRKCERRDSADRIREHKLFNAARSNVFHRVRHNRMVDRRDFEYTVLDLEHGCTAARQNSGAFVHDLLNGLALCKRNNLGTDRDRFAEEQRCFRTGKEQLHSKILVKIRRERNGCQRIAVIETPAVKLCQ